MVGWVPTSSMSGVDRLEEAAVHIDNYQRLFVGPYMLSRNGTPFPPLSKPLLPWKPGHCSNAMSMAEPNLLMASTQFHSGLPFSAIL